MRTIEQMVQQEIQCCVSSLVATLATGDAHPGTELAELCDRALGLAMPVPDYEEAAIQAGWTRTHDQAKSGFLAFFDNEKLGVHRTFLNWQELCESQELEPIDSEVYEHWAVSPWLAEKLTALGEKVDTDFAGLNVWACTTSGPQTSGDSVIARIYADMMRG